MMWQDVLAMVATIVISVGMIPAVRSKRRPPPRITCGAQALALTAIALSQVSLSMWLFSGALVWNAAMWYMLWFRKRGKKRKGE